MNRQRKVAILYGFGEGRWHSKRFARELTRIGFTLVEDTKAADIIVAHSGGCMLIDKLSTNQKLVFINPTYWPGKMPKLQAAQKLAGDVRYYLLRHPAYYFQKNTYTIYYVVRYWSHTRALMRAAKRFHMPDSLPVLTVPTILIRNDDDPWCKPDLEALHNQHNNLVDIKRLPGDHDDCWFNPQPYVNLLQSEV